MRRRKDKKTTQVILVSFIALIMITSVIGFIWGGSQKITYNDFKFEIQGNGFITKINKKEVFFYFLPMDVEQISLDNNIITKLSNTLQIDTTSELNDTNKEVIALVQFDLNQILSGHLNIYVRQGFTENNTYNLPVINCNNAKVPTIYFKTSDQNNISIEEDCIKIEAREARDFIIVRDRLLYSLLGVIK